MAAPDEAVMQAVASVAQAHGLLPAPEAGITVAVGLQALADGRMRRDEQVVLLDCATGPKYPVPPVCASVDRTRPVDFSRFV